MKVEIVHILLLESGLCVQSVNCGCTAHVHQFHIAKQDQRALFLFVIVVVRLIDGDNLVS